MNGFKMAAGGQRHVTREYEVTCRRDRARDKKYGGLKSAFLSFDPGVLTNSYKV